MGRAPCCDKDGLKKGPWTPEEDQKLIDYIKENGCGNWRTLPKNAGLQRCGKSCRLRWTNYLRPDIKRGRFSFEEEETIIQLHAILGNKWSAIAARLPGRTDNEIKNYWNTHIRKRLLRMGIDPVTHSPRLDLLDLSSILNSSLYGNSQSQVNFSRLLGMQNLINPELIRLASSILTSQRQNQENYLMQNQVLVDNSNNAQQLVLPNQNIPTSLSVQNPVDHQDLTIPTSLEAATQCVPIPQQHQEQQLMQYDDVQGFQQNLSGFGQETDWLQSIENYVPFAGYECYGSEQPGIQDPAPSSDNSTFEQYSNCSNNFPPSVFSSSMSTRSSSPAMNSNSNSNYVNGSSVTEDEKESYCSSSMFKYDNILDVSDYYM